MMPHNHELREQVHQILDLERIGKELSDGNPLDYEVPKIFNNPSFI